MDNDPMSPDKILSTICELVADAHCEPDGGKAATKAMAVVHLFHILDVMLRSGHNVPEMWRDRYVSLV